MNCYNCKHFKIIYKDTLVGKAYCTKYKKLLPVNSLAYNFWCDFDASRYTERSNEM